MNISSVHASPAGAANVQRRPASAPVTSPAAPVAEPVKKERGPVADAGQSHRSDVAALRQWINHPDRRAELALPDLTATHHGNGFRNAVAAYQAAIAVVPPATDPAPVIDPAPVTDPPSADGGTAEPAEAPVA